MTRTTDPALGALLEVCRRRLVPGAGRADLSRVDWHSADRLALFHNLQPLLSRQAEEGRLDDAHIPADVLASWESAHYRNFLFNSRALELLERLADAARRAGIELIAFKGPVTLARAFGDPALRVMVDLDLLLRRRDLAELSRLARRLGFAFTGQDHLFHGVASHAESGVGLELHFDLYDFLLRRDELLARALDERVELRLDGRSFPAAGPELALVLEVAHLVQDDFRVDLRRWLDLATLLLRPPEPPDWPVLEAALQRHGLQPELRLAVELAAELFAFSPQTVPIYRPGDYPPATRRRLVARLARYDRGPGRPALQDLAYRGGVGGKLSYLGRRLWPGGERWRALAGGRGPAAAATAYARQAIRTAAYELSRWRAVGISTARGSIKAGVYRRNRRPSRP